MWIGLSLFPLPPAVLETLAKIQDEQNALRAERLSRELAQRVDKPVLFENVGGDVFEAALWNMRDYGRIALCGMIANYNDAELQPGPRGMMLVIGRRLTIQGFIVSDHPEACEEYVRKAVRWLKDGKLKYRETVIEGIENAPQAFIDMLKGRNTGKQIVKLANVKA